MAVWTDYNAEHKRRKEHTSANASAHGAHLGDLTSEDIYPVILESVLLLPANSIAERSSTPG